MALNKLKKWIGTQLWSTFMTEYNENVDATNAAIDLAEQNTASISQLRGQIRGTNAQKGYDANTRSSYFKVVSLYQGVNVPHQGTGILVYTPYTEDWIHQKFIVIDGSGFSVWERAFHSGTTWMSWQAK